MWAAEALTIGVDGATNVLSRSMSNVIVDDPRPWFAEYLNADLKKESGVEVTRKIMAVISRLNAFMNPPLTPPDQRERVIFVFISDSCNLMRAVRESLHHQGVVQLTYGCSAHALNNFCADIAKLGSVKEGIRRAVFVAKTIKNQNLLNKIYSVLCRELCGRTYAMVLFSASRWSSINYMFVRLSKVKWAITAVIAAVLNEKDERQIDESYELPADFVSTLMDGSFWRSVFENVTIFDTICQCIGILESTTSTLSTVYACFVYIYLHVGRVMEREDTLRLQQKLLYRWRRIATPVHALAFFCDPFYRPFRLAIASSQADGKSLDLGETDIFEQCREGIKLLCCLDDDNGSRLNSAMKEFYTFSACDGKVAYS
ncbi:hypothetical protein DVH05_011041 [Phytophthora capsici]|nr:hypothetical protein DVH05_011041 [Phytophthora capsici]